jgi:hypothetical protein
MIAIGMHVRPSSATTIAFMLLCIYVSMILPIGELIMCNADPGPQKVGHWGEAEHIAILKLNLACVQVEAEHQWLFNQSSGIQFQQCSTCTRWSWRAPRADCVQKRCEARGSWKSSRPKASGTKGAPADLSAVDEAPAIMRTRDKGTSEPAMKRRRFEPAELPTVDVEMRYYDLLEDLREAGTPPRLNNCISIRM